MSRREDTVVSRLPNRFLRAATQVSQVKHMSEIDGFVDDFGEPTHAFPEPRHPGLDTSANRALAALDGVHDLPGWGAAAPPPAPRRPPPPPAMTPQTEITYRPEPAAYQQPAQPPRVEALASDGKVLCVFGCRGGAGSTTLAVNMGAQLVRAGKSVCVVDLDLQLGDVFVCLDLQPETSIAALAREASTIDGAALRRRLARHDSGVYALTQTGRIDDIDPQLVERLPALLATLTSHFDYVIVDGIRDFGDYALSVLDMADRVALVVTQDVPAVRRAARVVTLFRQLGYSDQKLELVLNRASRRAGVGEQEIERALGMRIHSRVRNDDKRVRDAMNQGALLSDVARSAGVAKDIARVTGRMAGLTAEARAATSPVQLPAKRGLLSMFRKDKKAAQQNVPALVKLGGN